MKRSSLLPLAELMGLLVAAGASLLLPSSPFTPYDVLWLVVGLVVLKLSDVWLPRGDAIGMSSALALGALLLFDARLVLFVLVVAELVAMAPRGRNQKWRTALSALTAEIVSVVSCSAALVPMGLHPSVGVLMKGGSGLLPVQYAGVLLVGLVFAALEFGLLQVASALRDQRPLAPSILGSLSFGTWLIAAQASAGVLAALMYRTMGPWGIAVSVVTILVMRQSFVLLLDIRQAYESTIDVLVRAMEAQSPGREGVAERNALLSTRAARALGLHGPELERVRYAALLLGIGDFEAASEALAASKPPSGSSRIVEDVEFLSNVLPILRICDSPRDAAPARRADLMCSYLIMAVGEATNTVSESQLREVRERVSPRIAREVDEAVSASLATGLSGAG